MSVIEIRTVVLSNCGNGYPLSVTRTVSEYAGVVSKSRGLITVMPPEKGLISKLSFVFPLAIVKLRLAFTLASTSSACTVKIVVSILVFSATEIEYVLEPNCGGWSFTSETDISSSVEALNCGIPPSTTCKLRV